ncbi:MAG: ABC transporter permease [Candidatus Peribacteria bacterium]|nr:ABC transporter permease [Candidatus Peribacteria bacterium]
MFFGNENPIGKKVEMGGKIFAVVGVLKNDPLLAG